MGRTHSCTDWVFFFVYMLLNKKAKTFTSENLAYLLFLVIMSESIDEAIFCFCTKLIRFSCQADGYFSVATSIQALSKSESTESDEGAIFGQGQLSSHYRQEQLCIDFPFASVNTF